MIASPQNSQLPMARETSSEVKNEPVPLRMNTQVNPRQSRYKLGIKKHHTPYEGKKRVEPTEEIVGTEATEKGAASGRRFNFNTVAALFFIACAVTLFLLIPTQIDKPLIVLGGSQSELPPELFPQLVASSFLILGIWLVVVSLSLRQKNELRDLDREAIVNVSVTLLIMAAYVFLMVNLGFVIGSALMIAVMSTYFGNRNYYLTAAVSITLPMLIFFLFRRVLLTELPPFPIDIYPLTHWSLI
jgi:tripartite tricarboxylate transporter TctB family protein